MSSGIYGTIADVKDKTLLVKISDNFLYGLQAGVGADGSLIRRLGAIACVHCVLVRFIGLVGCQADALAGA